MKKVGEMTVTNRREYMKKYRSEHREEHNAHVERWREKHPEQYREINRKSKRKWRLNNPEKRSVHTRIRRHPERYPLDNECAFCGVIENLEHGHLDYEDDGYNYLTVCRGCNHWMDKDKVALREPTLCDICAEKFSFLIVAWGRELTEEEKKFNKQLCDEGKAVKCNYFERYFNSSFKERTKRCEGFAN